MSQAGGFALERQYALEVKPATQILARRTVKPLGARTDAHAERTICSPISCPGTGKRRAVGRRRRPRSTLRACSQALDRYPLGCTEQIISRALPLLYANELSRRFAPRRRHRARQAHRRCDRDRARPPRLRRRLRTVVAPAATMPGSTPMSRTFSPGRGSAASPFRTIGLQARARPLAQLCEHGAGPVDRRRTVACLCALCAGAERHRAGRRPSLPRRRQAQRPQDADGEGARSAPRSPCSATASAPRRSFDVGARRRSPRTPKIEIGRTDYGSPLRDAAAVVTLAAEGDARKADPRQRHRAGRARARNLVQRHLDARECLARARRARARQAECQPRLSMRAAKHGPALSPPTSRRSSQASAVTVTNTGDTPVDAVVSVSGAPTTPEPAAEHGFTLERSFHTLDGEDADTAQAKQNERFVVVLKVTEPQPQFAPRGADRLSAGGLRDRQSAARVVGRHRHARLDRGCRHAGAYRVPRRPLHRGLRPRRTAIPPCSRSPMSCARSRRELRAAAGRVEDMYRPDRFGRTGTGAVRCIPPNEPSELNRSPQRGEARSARRVRGQAVDSPSPRPSLQGRGGSGAASARLRRGLAASRAWSSAQRRGLIDASDRPRSAATWNSPRSWSTATANCSAPTSRARAAGGCPPRAIRSIRAISTCCSPMRTSASSQHSGVDPLALRPRRAAIRLEWGDRVGRLDHHHAGRAPARAARQALALCQAQAGGARAFSSRAS